MVKYILISLASFIIGCLFLFRNADMPLQIHSVQSQQNQTNIDGGDGYQCITNQTSTLPTNINCQKIK